MAMSFIIYSYPCSNPFSASARVVDHVLQEPLFAHNAESVYVKDTAIGFTDQLASFVKLGYVAGPFKRPPLENFRVNQILGVQQTGKVRPVMNLSHPKHESFNDAIPDEAFPKVIQLFQLQ